MYSDFHVDPADAFKNRNSITPYRPNPLDESLHVVFEWKEEFQEYESNQQNRPIYHMKPYITIYKPGGDSTFREVTQDDKQRFYRQWQAFMEDEKKGSDGTPLKQWTLLNKAQVATFEVLNVFSVEQIANANDMLLQQMGMGARELQQKAILFLDQAEKGAMSARLVDEKKRIDEENERLRISVAQMAARLEVLEKEKESETKVTKQHGKSQ